MAERILMTNGKLKVTDNPIIPFIEGDGVGRDIWKNAQAIFDKAVEVSYGGQRRIEWQELLAGKKAFDKTGEWLPQETLEAIRESLVAIKGPLETPVGGCCTLIMFVVFLLITTIYTYPIIDGKIENMSVTKSSIDPELTIYLKDAFRIFMNIEDAFKFYDVDRSKIDIYADHIV